jgi:hypothetical protein
MNGRNKWSELVRLIGRKITKLESQIFSFNCSFYEKKFKNPAKK